MKAENIIDALNDVNDRFLADGDAPVRRRRTARWLGVMAAVLAVCMVLAVPALAVAYTDMGYTIMYALSPAMAQSLKPVNETCEKNGVRMTVDSAVIENNTAYIRIAMTDLEGDLFDDTLDLCDSYDIKKGFDASVVGGTCALEDYDEDTRTAVFLTQLAPLDGTLIQPGKVTFRLWELSGHTALQDTPVQGVDLSAVGEAADTVSMEASFFNADKEQFADRTIDCLPLGQTIVEICPGAEVSGLGWIDGKLHVQIRTDSGTSGIVYLAEAPEDGMDEGDIFAWARSPQYVGDHRMVCEDFIFDVSPDEAAALTLCGWFMIQSDPVQGPWEVTFPLE